MIHKLKEVKGLSLVEALCAALMLSLLCLMMHAGLQSAVKSYLDITAESETQLLLSSLSNALSDKLRYSMVTVSGGTPVCSVGEIKTEDGKVVIEEIRADGTTVEKALLPKGAYGKDGRYAAEVSVSANDVSAGEAIFYVNLKVKEASGEIGAETDMIVRCLNPVKTE